MKKTKWTDELIEEEIRKVISAMRLDRMPSRTEIEQVTGNSSLTNKISKTIGFREWAKKLNIPIKSSDTQIGNDYEFIIKDKLESMGYSVDKMDTRHPYDILVNGNIKIDVKVSNWYNETDGSKYHTFSLGKKNHNCDIFICVGLDDNGDVLRTMIIPSKFVMDIKQISCGSNSKYNRFIGKWDYINQYDSFYKEVI